MTSERFEAGQQAYFEQFDTYNSVSRVQTRVVHRNEDFDIYIGRGDGGKAHLNNTEIGQTGWLGNPYKTETQGGGYTRKQSLALYCADVLHRLDHDPEFASALAVLKGQRLACYCRYARESEPACHGDVLVATIEGLQPADTVDSASNHESDGNNGER